MSDMRGIAVEASERLLAALPSAFLIGADWRRGHPTLTVHSVRDSAGKGLELRAIAGDGVTVRERRHPVAVLDGAHSLEALVRKFRHDEILQDPTGFFARSVALARFAEKLRATSSDAIDGIYWNGEWRTIYVVFEAADFFFDGKVRAAQLGAAEDLVAELLTEASAPLGAGFEPVVRLGFEAPQVEVVAVDEESHFSGAGALDWVRRVAPVPAMAALIGVGIVGAAAAADLAKPMVNVVPPAASGPNFKIAFGGGFHDFEGFDRAWVGQISGSATIPLTNGLGLQADGIFEGGDATFYGAGGHFFWRDPAKGLLGATIGYAHTDLGGGDSVTQAGVEGELYLNQFSLNVAGGYQWGQNSNDGGYIRGDILWYVTDDLMLRVGGEHNPTRNLGRLGAELRPAIAGLPGLTLFADGRIGDNNYASVIGGIRLYFGQSKTLKDRHRRDDPISNLANLAIDALLPFECRGSKCGGR